ncbi:polysaccharide pyruvyl transferase family protein [Arthrobacter rhombi]|uniref:polysaccharide pyruvyl transferase family protein n=1 Tax=Arthrobacter rhombi TaxID=71253 RepID=UPI003FD014FC
MSRILIRAGKSPFSPIEAYETFDRNLIGNNNGNLLFSSAAHKMLAADGVAVKAHGFNFSAAQAPKASSEFDHFVLPLANAFRVGFEPQLNRITQFIEKLTIPTVMLSGGAQSGPDGTFDNLKPIEGSVKAFCKAVLKTSSHITVRGEKTANYIRGLGFTDVMVIGCPSITMNGPGHTVESVRNLSRFNIAYNIESSKDLMGELVDEVEKRHDAIYFPQDMGSFEMMLWGSEQHKAGRDPRLPLRMDHDQFTTNKAEFHLDPYTWINRMRDFDLSFGPRIHGNVIPILAGIPSVVFAHDSRTKELSEYHEIPHFTPDEVNGVTSLSQVIERADFTKFNAGHTARFNKVTEFLNNNGIKTIYDAGQENARNKYEARLAGIKLPDPQKSEWAGMSPGELARLRKQRAVERSMAKLTTENAALKKVLKKQAVALKPLVSLG